MSDKHDVAALTDEQCDEFWFDGDGHRGPIRAAYAAGRASLQANVPADVAALIASYAKPKYLGARERNPMCGDIVMISVETARATAAALQSQAERIAELEDSVRGWEACLIRANAERDQAERK